MAYYRAGPKEWEQTPESRSVAKLTLAQLKDMAYEPGSATVQRYGWKNIVRELIRRLETNTGT